MESKKEVSEFLNQKFEDLRQEYSELRQFKDPALFTYICVKYFFLGEDDYDVDEVLKCICDTSNDCSIDAICNDHTDEDQPLVFIQTKHTSFDFTTAKGEIEEIGESVKKLRSKHYNAFNDKVVDSYNSADDDAQTKDYAIYYFCSDVPAKNQTRKKAKELEQDNVRVVFGDEIKQTIEGILSKSGTIERGELDVDQSGNKLSFEESVVVNISAMSLKSLYSRYRTALLGLNLRFYVKNKAVDKGLKDTISENNSAFWYLNNGMVIVCNNYELEGKKLKLAGFSIVNGGQTCQQIFKTDFDKDFFILCKVVKADEKKEGRTSEKIAEASNSQKPIKAKDLAANRQEQRRLGGELKKLGFQYLTKQGMTIEKAYKSREKHATIDQIGKLVLATVLQHPWVRSNPTELYKDDKIYHLVYTKTKPQMMIDLLRVDYYKDYLKTDFCSANKKLVKNARTYVLALIVYVSYYIQSGDKLPELTPQNVERELPKLVEEKFTKMERLIVNKIDDEKNVFYELFNKLTEDVLCFCFQMATGGKQDSASALDESNFLKKKDSHYLCLPRLNGSFAGMRKIADALFLRKDK